MRCVYVGVKVYVDVRVEPADDCVLLYSEAVDPTVGPSLWVSPSARLFPSVTSNSKEGASDCAVDEGDSVAILDAMLARS